jgi:hypothetical protein
MTFFIARVTKLPGGFAKENKIPNFVTHKPNLMKRVLAAIALLGFLASCSSYTCPTYSKKEVKKGHENKI